MLEGVDGEYPESAADGYASLYRNIAAKGRLRIESDCGDVRGDVYVSQSERHDRDDGRLVDEVV